MNLYNRKGMIVYVYRVDETDCTNKGISYDRSNVILIGENVPQIFRSGSLPVVELRYFGGYIYAAPYEAANRSSAFGGNFIWSSDSRFPSRQPIALHDRFERSCQIDERYYRLVKDSQRLRL